MASRFILRKELNRKYAIEAINQLPLDGTMEIVIRKFEKTRSTDSNRLYWKWLEVIAGHTGYSKEELHEYFRKKYGYWKNKDVFGVAMAIPVSTTKYTTKQFSNYMTQVEAEASTLGIVLPHPEDMWLEGDYRV